MSSSGPFPAASWASAAELQEVRAARDTAPAVRCHVLPGGGAPPAPPPPAPPPPLSIDGAA